MGSLPGSAVPRFGCHGLLLLLLELLAICQPLGPRLAPLDQLGFQLVQLVQVFLEVLELSDVLIVGVGIELKWREMLLLFLILNIRTPFRNSNMTKRG